MSDWGIVVPEGVTNLCTEPSFELTPLAVWTAGGTNAIAQSSDQAFLGVYSAKCTYADNTALASYPITLPTASTSYVLQARVWIPSNFDYLNQIMIYGAFFTSGVVTCIHCWDGSNDGAKEEWVYLETLLTVDADVTGNIIVYLIGAGAPTVGRYVYIDAVQVEEASTVSHYCDGDQPGCSWSSTAHASTSSRSAVSRAGGVVKDLKDDYGLGVAEMMGTGAAPLTVGVKGYSFLPGGIVSGIKVNPRQFSLVGTLKGSGADCDLHAARQALAKELAHNRYPEDDEGWQPVRIRYTGADVEKQISAHYAGGLEAAIKLEDRIHEKVALRFVADDPMWYELGESKAVLDSNDTLAVRYIASRLRSTGLWDNLSVGVGGSVVQDIKVDTDNTLVACGGWATIDGVANTSRIARYNPMTDAWTALNNGATDGAIYAMTWGADGSLYVGGTFTSMDNGAGPVANTSRIAKWDGSNWSALGTGANGSVLALTVGHDGALYAGGAFYAMGGVANTDCIAAWNGTNWVSISSGITGNNVYALAIGATDFLWAGGDFTVLNGVTVNRIAVYDILNTTWYAAEGGASAGNVNAIACISGKKYAGGSFTGMGAASVNYVAVYDGVAWKALGDGVNNAVLAIAEAPDGLICVGGSFTEAGGITNAAYLAKWNGASWSRNDAVSLPAAVYSIEIANTDPVTSAHDLHIGFSNVGNVRVSGTVTVTNAGSTVGYPSIIIKRTGGTSAILMTIRNETSGAQLLFDYSLLDGETLTIDLTPMQKSIVSSFFGDRMDATLAGSDFGTFCLLPGDNNITCFVAEAGAPTVTATMIWKDTYLSFD